MQIAPGVVFAIRQGAVEMRVMFRPHSPTSTLPSLSEMKGENDTFSPACRNNWHIHHAKSGGGQLLLCTDGLGWYQEAGKSAQALHPGDVVTIPAGVKHWHGAQKDCWFSHIAVECPGEETSNEWCEPVTDAEYAALDASEAKI